MAEHIPDLADEYDEMVRTYWLRRGTLTGTVIGILIGVPMCFIPWDFHPAYVLAVTSSCGGGLGWMWVRGHIC